MGCTHSKDDVAAVRDSDVSSRTIGSTPRSALLQRLSRRGKSGSKLDEYRRAAALSWTRPVPVDEPRRREPSPPPPPPAELGLNIASPVALGSSPDVASPVVSPNPLVPMHGDFSVVSRSTTPTEAQQPDTPLVFSALNAQIPSRSPRASGTFDVQHIGDGSSNSVHLARSCDAADGDDAGEGSTSFILRDALQPPSSSPPASSLSTSLSLSASTPHTATSLHDEQRKRSAAILRRHRAVSHDS